MAGTAGAAAATRIATVFSPTREYSRPVPRSNIANASRTGYTPVTPPDFTCDTSESATATWTPLWVEKSTSALPSGAGGTLNRTPRSRISSARAAPFHAIDSMKAANANLFMYCMVVPRLNENSIAALIDHVHWENLLQCRQPLADICRRHRTGKPRLQKRGRDDDFAPAVAIDVADHILQGLAHILQCPIAP